MDGVEIIGPRQTTAYAADSTVVDVFRVELRIDGSGPFYVDIPVNEFTPENTRTRVEAFVQNVRDSVRAIAQD